MSDTVIITDLSQLCSALYDKMVTTAVPGCTYVGFQSSLSQKPLPKVAMQISVAGLEVDSSRPLPSGEHRIYLGEGSELTGTTYDADGNPVSKTYYETYATKHPTPMDMSFDIRTWCHDAQTALQMDLAMLSVFPKFGFFDLDIGGTDYTFPIEMLSSVVLDDLTENFIERVYRFKIELYAPGHLADGSVKTITSGEFSVFDGDEDDAEADTGILLGTF